VLIKRMHGGDNLLPTTPIVVTYFDSIFYKKRSGCETNICCSQKKGGQGTIFYPRYDRRP